MYDKRKPADLPGIPASGTFKYVKNTTVALILIFIGGKWLLKHKGDFHE